MNKQFEMVREFQKAMEQPVAEIPTPMDQRRQDARYDYMQEELDEFDNADTLVDQADAMIDLIYLALGTLVEMGVQPERLFRVVHEANMSKLWDDGKPRFREGDGKVLKPPHFVRPEPLLEKEIKLQQLKADMQGFIERNNYELSADKVIETYEKYYKGDFYVTVPMSICIIKYKDQLRNLVS